MTTLTIQLDERLAEKVRRQAQETGSTVDAVVSAALDRPLAAPATGLVELIRRAKAEGWKSEGPFLTDEEMYGH